MPPARRGNGNRITLYGLAMSNAVDRAPARGHKKPQKKS
jgi:hypothetical protein